MKTTLLLRSRSLNLIMSAALCGSILSACTKETIEPSSISSIPATKSERLSKPRPVAIQEPADIAEQKTKVIEKQEPKDQVLFQLDEIAPIGKPSFKVEVLSSGKVRVVGIHDVNIERSEIRILPPNTMFQIQDLMNKIKTQDASALRDLGAGTDFSTVLTMPAILKGEMCFQTKMRADKPSEEMIELKKVILNAAGIAELIDRSKPN